MLAVFCALKVSQESSQGPFLSDKNSELGTHNSGPKVPRQGALLKGVDSSYPSPPSTQIVDPKAP